jgi:SAM-dependent methyltransferase
LDWHARFSEQAGWTASLRDYIFEQTGFTQAERILEVGCGTGAVLSSLPASPAAIFGLDHDFGRLRQAREYAPLANYTLGDALTLPYLDACFDIAYTHYTLLWLTDPLEGLREMARVVRPGGAVIAMAEPDYGGRIDSPESLAALGRMQTESLRSQGADPTLGRRLGELFIGAHLRDIHTGILGAEWRPTTTSLQGLEWAVIASDLEGFVSTSELERLRQIDERAWLTGERVLFVPTFYAWGKR